jgi:glycine dehydrogenase
MTDRLSLAQLEPTAPFVQRHIGPSADEQAKMLAVVGYGSLGEMVADAVPEAIQTLHPLDLPEAAGEAEMQAELKRLAGRNRLLVSMIGLGYSDTVTPPVIRRQVVENPAWYTSYTPYQPEISQGRLEALLNFQTMVADLTGLDIANASLLDESTAAAEAMALCHRAARAPGAFVVDADCHPQTIAVVRTRAEPLGLEVVVADLERDGLPDAPLFGVLVQFPGSSGVVRDHTRLVEEAHRRGALVAVAADLLALTLLRPPGEIGADVVVGSAQRFGVPLWFGGPHAGFIAVRKGLERQLPGRLVGVSIDADSKAAYRLSLQPREQHIRREKATSNICTAQSLPAVVASMYAIYHGPEGLATIARRAHRYAAILAAGLRAGGVEVVHQRFFDTVMARVPGRADAVVAAAQQRGMNLRRFDADHVGISSDEVTCRDHLERVWAAFGVAAEVDPLDRDTPDALGEALARGSAFLTHPVFHRYRSETAMLRYMRQLSDRDIALDRAMIPLGSCTMKLNAAAEMEPITWPELASIHPFAPLDQVEGYRELIAQLERWLEEITGYDRVSLQPNAGSQGELAGLLAIRAYHRSRGSDRDVCLIPSSAHGTNAASAAMAGLRVVVVACDDQGNVDLEDLHAKLEAHRDRLAVIMVTYPSTHGVFEPRITEVFDAAHRAGGQVYVDGANLNALVGLARPGEFGADVSHLNLHKTFCIPHGGGGPGVGPVGVREHLAPFLPSHPLRPEAGPSPGTIGPISAAAWGSAGILPISWAYVRMMGADGLRRATEVAILGANYVARRLAPHYPVLYTGRKRLVAHECILDLRRITRETGVTAEDVAKRLIDYGFHAPTMSFPVAGTLMVEPTESENQAELDRFCEAMIAIRHEIARVAAGELDREDNPLRNSPHTAEMIAGDWPHPYSRELAAFPVGSLRHAKYWPPVRRIQSAYGDRNLVCTCPPVSAWDG